MLGIYEDLEGDFKQEQNICSGQESLFPTLGPENPQTVWSNFYGKLSEIDIYHDRNKHLTVGQEELAHKESLEPEALFAKEMDAVLDTSDRIFSGEEGHGKYLDLHTHYMSFCNIKKLKQLNLIKADDYLTWIQNLDKFALVPLYIKQSSKYDNYVAELSDYLKDFF